MLLVVEMDVVLEVLAVLEEVEVVVKVKEVELLLEEKVEVDVVLEVLEVEIVEEAVVVLVKELPDALSRLSFEAFWNGLTGAYPNLIWKLPACGLLCSLPVTPRYAKVWATQSKITNINLHDV